MLDGAPADIAGLKAGDIVLSVATRSDNVEVVNADNVSDFIATHNGEDIAFRV